MGSGASTFSMAKEIYEQHKDKPDEELLSSLLSLYQPPSEEVVASGVKEVPVEKEESAEERLERQQAFLVACGKFSKSVGSKPDARAVETLYINRDRHFDIHYKDEDEWTALHHAAGEGHLKIAEYLIEECHHNIDACDDIDVTPLWVAACNDQRDIVKLLLYHGANEQIVGRPEGEPPQKPALAARRQNHPGIGDLIDCESEMRAEDSERIERQQRGEMSLHGFNDGMRSRLKSTRQ